MRRFAFLSMMTILAMGLALQGCETMEPMGAAPAGMGKAPTVKLERVEVNHIQPFFVGARLDFKDCNNPGRVGGHGETSTMSMAYLFEIANPTSAPVMLEELRFTIAFEGFDVNMPTFYDKQWVPSGKTNQLRVVVVQEANPTIASLMVGGLAAERVKKMGTTQVALVKKWWDTVGDAAFPVQVKNGVANFVGPDGKPIMVTFQGVFPPPK